MQQNYAVAIVADVAVHELWMLMMDANSMQISIVPIVVIYRHLFHWQHLSDERQHPHYSMDDCLQLVADYQSIHCVHVRAKHFDDDFD